MPERLLQASFKKFFRFYRGRPQKGLFLADFFSKISGRLAFWRQIRCKTGGEGAAGSVWADRAGGAGVLHPAGPDWASSPLLTGPGVVWASWGASLLALLGLGGIVTPCRGCLCAAGRPGGLYGVFRGWALLLFLGVLRSGPFPGLVLRFCVRVCWDITLCQTCVRGQANSSCGVLGRFNGAGACESKQRQALRAGRA